LEKNLGNLSEESRQRLVDSKILDYKRDMKGLKEGTEAILGKNGTKQISPRKMKKHTTKIFIDAINSSPELKKSIARDYSIPLLNSENKIVSNSIVKGVAKANVRQRINQSGGYISSNDGKYVSFGKSPKKLNKHPAVGSELKEIYKKMLPLEKQYVDKVFRRHEIDETRELLSKKKSNRRVNILGVSAPATSTSFGHYSPGYYLGNHQMLHRLRKM